MGQPFAKPEDEITPNMTLPNFSSNTTKGPSLDNCNNDSALKQLLIDYIDFKQYGTSIEKRTEAIKQGLDDRIKELEEDKKNYNIEYTIKETDFKLTDKKVQNLKKINSIAIYFLIILFLILLVVIFS